MIFARWTDTVFTLKLNSVAISLFDLPATMCCSISSSRGVRPVSRSALQRTASRNLRIEYGLALGHFLDRR